jgi:hypothetical protein
VNNRRFAQLYRIVFLALVVWGLYLTVFRGMIDVVRWLQRMRYFTIQSNLLVVVATTYLLFAPDRGRSRAMVRGIVLLSILVTGLVFHLVLVPQSPVSVGDIGLGSHLNHTVAPLGFALDWLLFDRKGQMRPRDVVIWSIYPFLYWLVMVVQGEFTGFYPYFFMDVDSLGWAGVLLWLAGLLIGFVLLGLLLIGLDRLLGRRAKRHGAW